MGGESHDLRENYESKYREDNISISVTPSGRVITFKKEKYLEKEENELSTKQEKEFISDEENKPEKKKATLQCGYYS